jgi:hypothetical protein
MIIPLGRRPKRHCARRVRPDQAMCDIFRGAPQTPCCRAFLLRPLAAALGVLAVSGCAQNSAPDLAQASSPMQTEARICRPDPALLVPQSAPDCVFRRQQLKTLDPDQWARLKIEYERQCYQDAEKSVRNRLRRLQAANRCETRRAMR